MRVSVDKDDPGYPAYKKLTSQQKGVSVYLDGVEVRHCITADDAEGMVRRHVLTPDGHPQLDLSNPHDVWVEVARGAVRIETFSSDIGR